MHGQLDALLCRARALLPAFHVRVSGHWIGTVNNTELRPLLASINHELVESVSDQAAGLDIQAIRTALQLNVAVAVKSEDAARGSAATLPLPSRTRSAA